MTLLINNHGFCPQLSYLIGEVGLSRGGGFVSVIRFTPLSSTLTPARKYTNANDELPEVGGGARRESALAPREYPGDDPAEAAPTSWAQY